MTSVLMPIQCFRGGFGGPGSHMQAFPGKVKRCSSPVNGEFETNGFVRPAKRLHTSSQDTEHLLSLTCDLLNQSEDLVENIDSENFPDSNVLDELSDYFHSPNELAELRDSAESPSTSTSQESVDSVHSPGTDFVSSADSTKCVSPTTKPLYTAELQVLCRICGDRASGFHYGVHSCEGCKGFFRRTLKKQLVYKPCRESQQCSIDAGSRNKCQYCRYQKCLNAGMSQTAVRFGRMPKAEREKLVADKEELKSTCTKRFLQLRSLSDSVKAAFQVCFHKNKIISYYLINTGLDLPPVKVEPEFKFYTNTLDSVEFHSQGIFQCFQESVVPLIEGTVKFSKKIPVFASLPMSERIKLLKQNAYCVTLVLMHAMMEENTVILDTAEKSMSVTNVGCFGCTETESLFHGLFSVCQKLKNMSLKLVEVSLFSAVLLLLECPGLGDTNSLEELQMELLSALRLELKHNHPKEHLLFPRLLVLIPQLIEVAENFRRGLLNMNFDKKDGFKNTHRLLVEIFELVVS